MTHKKLLRSDRLRQIPPQFSWLDHQLVRQHRLRHCEPPAWALYLFLVTVADARGLSFYSDPSLQRHLSLDGVNLARARQQLIEADLIAHRKPLYQVLSLPETAAATEPSPAVPAGKAQSVGEILRQVLGGTP